MSKKALVGLALVAVFVALGPVSARADSLIGDVVNLDIFFPDVGTVAFTDSNTVGAGPEFIIDGGDLVADLGASTIDISFGGGFTLPGPLFALVFSDLNAGGILGLALTTNVPGMDVSRLEFSGDAVAVHLAGLDVTGASSIRVTLLTPRAVPLPSGLMLLAAGLMAVTAFGARRR